MADAAATGGGKPKASIELILVLVNTIAVAAALGTFVYTKLMFKRPPITENVERAKLDAEKNKLATSGLTSALISFDPITVNIKTVTAENDNGTPIQAKLHYVTVTFTGEIRDQRKKAVIEAIKATLADRIMNLIGKKSYNELTTVQGRYVLRTQMIDLANDQIQKVTKEKDVVITNFYFTQFMVQ